MSAATPPSAADIENVLNLTEEAQADLSATVVNLKYPSRQLRIDEYKHSKKCTLSNIIIYFNLAFCFADMMYAVGNYSFPSNQLMCFLFADAFMSFSLAATISFLFEIEKVQNSHAVGLIRAIFLLSFFMGFVALKVEQSIDNLRFSAAKEVCIYLFLRVFSHFTLDIIFLHQFFSSWSN